MKTLLLIFLALCITATTNASNYYFSANSGDDSRTAAMAQNPTTPWKTLSKLNSFFTSLLPGDSILLKRGETFYGSVVIKKSGTATAPIVFGSYGSGNKPVITSLLTLSGWTFKGNGIWEADSSFGSTAANMVLLNGVSQEMGRYPNSNEANKGYLNFESHVGKTSITDSQLNTSINWAGAELVTRPRHWILNRSLITAQSGHTLTYATNSPYQPYDNYGYFIQNNIKTLDKAGEWYFNTATKKLSIYFGAGNPSTYNVEAAAIDNIISSTNYSNIVFDNLVFKGANASAFNITSGSNIYIQNCAIQFSGKTAVLIHGHTNFHVENCSIANSNNIAIDLEYGVNKSVIKNNSITNTAMFAGMLQNGEGTGLGIYSNGDDNIIENNTIHSTGFIGITFYGNNAIIKNNFIDSFCFVKDDGGGIYTHGGTTRTINRKVIGNIVLDGIGAGPGTDFFDKRSVTGIYMDANTTDVEIRDNTVSTCDQGILLQSSSEMIVKNNTSYDNIKQLTIIQVENDFLVRNNQISHNILFSKQKEQWVSYIISNRDDINLFGQFDSNYYARPIDDRINIYNSRQTANGTVAESFELQGWKDKYNKDSGSKKTAKTIAPYRISGLTGDNKFINGDFTTNIKGVSTTATTLSFDTSGVLNGGCLMVVPLQRGSSIYFKVGAITAGKLYSLSYTVKGSPAGDMSMGASVRQSGFPYGELTTVQYRTVTNARNEYEVVFSSPVSEPSGIIMLKVDGLSKFYVDNIKFYEANISITDVDDSLRFDYNKTNAVKSVALHGSYINAKGELYANNILLQPFTSAVLIKTADIQNIAPAVSLDSAVGNTIFFDPATITLTSTASDVDGSIAKVDFYNGFSLLGSDTSSPYTMVWTPVGAGDYTVTAKATDNAGKVSTSAPVMITVAPAPVAPVVSLTSPLANTPYIAPAAITITALATDADGSIARVDFYNDTTLIGSDSVSPYTMELNAVAPGNYSLTAIATDNSGMVTTSSAVMVTVAPAPVAPVVSLTSPLANTPYIAPAAITITAPATDADGSIARVDFYNDTTLIGSDSVSPYTMVWTAVTPGAYFLTAKATDNSGMVASSSTVAVTVAPAPVAPVVYLTSPVANAGFNAPASITITAIATDADGSIVKVEFYNGTTLLTIERKLPYSWVWPNVPAGNYSITAKATDNSGRTSTSKIISITVNQNIAPLVNLTSPLLSAVYNDQATVIIGANAGDLDGSVARVAFYNGNTLLGVDSASPYSFDWVKVPAGNYAVTAKATDNGGKITSSAAVTFSVSPASVAPAATISNFTGTTISPYSLFDSKDKLITNITIGPNPASNSLSVFTTGFSNDSKFKISIVSMSGQMIKTLAANSSNRVIRVDVSAITAGMYLLKLQSGNTTIFKQFEKL